MNHKAYSEACAESLALAVLQGRCDANRAAAVYWRRFTTTTVYDANRVIERAVARLSAV